MRAQASLVRASKVLARAVSATKAGASRAGKWALAWLGVNQYSVHTPWGPSGFGDKIEFSFTADDPGNGSQAIVSNVNSLFYIRVQDASGLLQVRFAEEGTGSGIWLTSASVPIVAGQKHTGYVEFGIDGTRLVIDGVETPLGAIADLSTIDSGLIGGYAAGYFNGTIHYLKYTNATAMQNTTGVKGNGVDLYGALPTAGVFSGDRRVKVWCRRHDSGGASYQPLLGGTGFSNEGYLLIHDSNAASPDKITCYFDALPINADNALVNIAEGQDFELCYESIGGVQRLLLDGVEIFSRTVSNSTNGPASIGKFYGGGVFKSIVHDIELTDLSGQTPVVHTFDLTGNDGSVIPYFIDGVRQGTDGTWMNYDQGTDQVVMSQLSRHYPMNDGPDSNVLVDILGDGTTDATLYNVDPEDWSN